MLPHTRGGDAPIISPRENFYNTEKPDFSSKLANLTGL
jgi:hypothetical protein